MEWYTGVSETEVYHQFIVIILMGKNWKNQPPEYFFVPDFLR